MRNLVLICLVCFFIYVNIALASLIEVDILETLEGDISSLNYDNSSNIVKFTTEFNNKGSVSYKTRIKIVVFDGDDVIFTSWSKENVLMPGDKKVFENYWFSDGGKYDMKIRAYLGNEIKDYKKFEISLKDIEPEDVFEIKNLRSYDDYVVFDVFSSRDVEDVVIMPSQYILGWIFEQESIENMHANSTKTVKISYYPSVWMPSDVKILVASDEGKYFSEESFEMEKNTGLWGLFYFWLDSLKLVLG